MLTARVRSFVMRAGRMTAGQERGWQQGRYRSTPPASRLGCQLGGAGRRVVEIGFGMGDSLLSNEPTPKPSLWVSVHRMSGPVTRSGDGDRGL